MKRLSIFIIFVSCSCSGSSHNASRNIDDLNQAYIDSLPELHRDLVESISRIAKKHNINEKALIKYGLEKVLRDYPLIAKPVSTIGNDRYIYRKSSKNEISIKEKKWTGREKGNSELFVLIDDRVEILNVEPSYENLTFILFENDEIQYLDWTQLVGGKLKRIN